MEDKPTKQNPNRVISRLTTKAPVFQHIWTHHCSSVCAGCLLKWSKPSHRNRQLQSWTWLRVDANIGLERTDTSCIIHWLRKQFDADFFYAAPSSITCCRDEYRAENKVMCDVKPAFGWINSWKIRPKCQEKRENTFRRPPCVHGFQSSLTFLSLVLVNSKIDYEMKKKKLSSRTADSGFKTLGWRSAVTRNRKWKTKQSTENVPDLKETIWRMKRSSKWKKNNRLFW